MHYYVFIKFGLKLSRIWLLHASVTIKQYIHPEINSTPASSSAGERHVKNKQTNKARVDESMPEKGDQ